MKHSADHNITKAESEKIAKYNDLTIEFKDMYKLKSVEKIPIAISATDLITKGGVNEWVAGFKSSITPLVFKQNFLHKINQLSFY